MFVVQVIEKSGDNFLVKFLKKIPGFDTFVWPDVDNIGTFKTVNIIEILPEPQMDRLDRITFSQ